MKANEKVGWGFFGLIAGITVASLLVFASFGAAAFFSGGVTPNASEEQAMPAR